MKFNNNLFKGLIFKHFAVQKGMYFNNSIFEDYGSFYFSDNIADEYWNYFIPDDAYSMLKGFNNIKSIIKEKESEGYNVAICIPSFIDNFNLICKEVMDNGYHLLSEESWMIVDKPVKYHKDDKYTCSLVKTEKEINDFISVFSQAYGGEKTDISPYGALDKSYIECINNNKDNEYIKNYVLYVDNMPVSCGTVNIINGIGGLYGLGTIPSARGKGYGSILNNYIVQEYFNEYDKFLFLQTEKGSNVEKWYQKMQYKEVFYLNMYVKDSDKNE